MHVQQGQKLRAMYRSLGWSRADCAKFLHVTERSLHNWESGRHAIPFAAYRLMRIHCGYRLPGRAWDGWSISAGKLWTPEGYGLKPSDAAWWSMLVRRAEVGSQALKQLHEAKRLAGGAGAGHGAVAPCAGAAVQASAGPQGLRRAAPLDLSNGHNRNSKQGFGVSAGSSAIGQIALGQWILTNSGVRP